MHNTIQNYFLLSSKMSAQYDSTPDVAGAGK